MEVFQDLYVNATAEQMAALVPELEKALPEGWTRDHGAEQRARSGTVVTPRPTYCFSCTETSERAAAVLALAEKEPGRFYVSNIVPSDSGELTYTQYNAILSDFYSKVFKQSRALNKLPHNLTPPVADLDRWMSPETADLLRRFSGFANRSSGCSHPKDQERWNAFVVAAHKEDSKLDSSTLRRWLIETEGWPEYAADELATEYGRARELLKYAVAHNGI